MKIPYHIAIEGTIGVGKTSLAKILGERLEAKLIIEEFEENPFLVEFYKDSDHYAFQTQLFFLLSESAELKMIKIISENRKIISEKIVTNRKIISENVTNREN